MKQSRSSPRQSAIAGEMQRRFDPLFSYRTLISAYKNILGLRCAYFMNAVDSAGAAIDSSGLGQHLSLAGTATTYDRDAYCPYVDFAGTGRLRLATAADLTVSGVETFIKVGNKGMTVGGWFKPDDTTPVAQETLVAKWASGASESFSLDNQVGGNAIIYIHQGANTCFLQSTELLTPNQWNFVMGGFETSTGHLWLHVNGVYLESGALLCASIGASTADFTIGARHAADNPYSGLASAVLYAGAYASAPYVQMLYDVGRAAFGLTV